MPWNRVQGILIWRFLLDRAMRTKTEWLRAISENCTSWIPLLWLERKCTKMPTKDVGGFHASSNSAREKSPRREQWWKEFNAKYSLLVPHIWHTNVLHDLRCISVFPHFTQFYYKISRLLTEADKPLKEEYEGLLRNWAREWRKQYVWLTLVKGRN